MKRFDTPSGYLVVSRKKRRTNAIQDERLTIFVHTVAPFRPLTQQVRTLIHARLSHFGNLGFKRGTMTRPLRWSNAGQAVAENGRLRHPGDLYARRFTSFCPIARATISWCSLANREGSLGRDGLARDSSCLIVVRRFRNAAESSHTEAVPRVANFFGVGNNAYSECFARVHEHGH